MLPRIVESLTVLHGNCGPSELAIYTRFSDHSHLSSVHLLIQALTIILPFHSFHWQILKLPVIICILIFLRLEFFLRDMSKSTRIRWPTLLELFPLTFQGSGGEAISFVNPSDVEQSFIYEK